MAGSQDAWPSAAASVAMVCPAAMPGRYRAQAASSAEASSAWAASTTVAKNGEHANAAPISSSTTSSSVRPNPSPPYSLGSARPGSLSWRAIWSHTAGS